MKKPMEIWETEESMTKRWEKMSDPAKDKFKRDIEKWEFMQPHTAAVLRGEHPDEDRTIELVNLGQERRGEPIENRMKIREETTKEVSNE